MSPREDLGESAARSGAGPGSRVPGPPAISLAAGVHAKSARWASAPRVTSDSHARPGHESSHATEREGLPERVRSGTTYRRVAVRVRTALALRAP